MNEGANNSVPRLTKVLRSGCFTWPGHLARSLVVVQNFISSLFNSPLFDFQGGWIYVLGVGVAGGMALRAKPSGS